MSQTMTGKRLLVMGAGKSGRAAARFGLEEGASVVLADDMGRASLPPEVDALEAGGVKIAAGGIAGAGLAFDLCVLSPGISINDTRVRALAGAGVEVVSELELASRYLDAPMIGITGTNGKTTVTTLVGELLRAAGKNPFVGGNVGTPLIEAVGGGHDVLVVEISSFQLEAAPTLHPAVAVWLNLTGDHLDRHGDLDGYARAKARIFANQTPADAAVVNRDDPVVWAAARTGQGTVLPFSTEMTLGVGAWMDGDDIVVLMPSTDGKRLDSRQLRMKGRHNLSNVLSALLAVAALGVDVRKVWEAACGFEGLGHRIQEFLSWRGVTFVNDSKATNVDAAVKAVEAVGGPLVWLGGGVEKGSDYGPLAKALKSVGKLAVLVGPNTARMERELAGAVELVTAADWTEAVRVALAHAAPGDKVLMAPAAASFDFFKSYAHRGDVFMELCRRETAALDREETDDGCQG